MERWEEGKGKDWGIGPKIFWLVENGNKDRVGGVAADKESSQRKVVSEELCHTLIHIKPYVT